MENLRDFLNFNQSYFSINREERNIAAIFYHVLLIKDNLKQFLDKIGCKQQTNSHEYAIYYEYAFLRDLWQTMNKMDIHQANTLKRNLIITFLKPKNTQNLIAMNVQRFNFYFGVPNASKKHIQYPGTWSINKFKNTIQDNEEFINTCQFKWAFNAKPDIVIHLSNNVAICIETKYESKEGYYPTNHTERMEFKKRGLNHISQTRIQEKILKELLGIETSFILLIQKPNIKSETYKIMSWQMAFEGLDITTCQLFIKESIKHLINPLT